MRRWVNLSVITGLSLAATVAFGCAGSDAGGEDSGGAAGVSSNVAGAAGLSGGMAGTGTSGTGVINNGMAGTGLVNQAGTSGNVEGDMPCDVSTIVANNCQTCHGARPIGGAPMPLVTLADWQKDYVVNTTASLKGQMMKVHQIAKIRVNAEMGTMRMPQGAPLSAEDLGTLNGWLTAGAHSGTECGVGGAAGMDIVGAGAGGAGGSAGTGAVLDPGDQCKGGRESGVYDPLVAMDGESCYDFRSHGTPGVGDTSKFTIPLNETYSQFYFKVPWAAGSVATRFGTDFDNEPVLHHWLMFSSHEAQVDGGISPNVLGTTLLTDSELIAGWAIGGCNTTYPEDVGVKLPEPNDGLIMVQWHHYNSTGSPQEDGSAAQICVVPAGARPNTAGLTFLGTENMTVPAGQMADAGGVCINDSGAPITIIGFTPHMHRIGINMKSVVDRAGGGPQETVFDEVFQPEYQTNYMIDPHVVLQPNDVITSTCTYMNTTSRSVTFGQSTDAEMCYQFALAYPYGALNNGVISLIGATNTCW